MKKTQFTISVLLILSILCTILATPVFAAENMTHDYEVKFLLNADAALDDNGELVDEVRNWFTMPTNYDSLAVQFIDTDDQDFNGQGWSSRIRHKDGDSNFKLTYKKRYSINEGDITSALNQANSDGFDAKETSYKAQVDWGYSKMTLSFSNNKKYSAANYGSLDLPDNDNSLTIIKDKLPGKVNKWVSAGWGQDKLNEGRVYGPVVYSKYTGEFQGQKTVIEIWPMMDDNNNTEYLVEVSFKADTFTEASSLRSSLFSFLDEKGIVLHEDGLKTQSIMNHY